MVDEVEKDDTLEEGDLVGGDDDLSAEVLDDGLDIDAVEEFDEDDFDENFDDDFEEEIVGEYDLADDSYGKEFENNFGHLTKPKEEPAPAVEAPAAKEAPAKEAKKPTKKAAPAKTAKATKAAAAKQPARKK